MFLFDLAFLLLLLFETVAMSKAQITHCASHATIGEIFNLLNTPTTDGISEEHSVLIGRVWEGIIWNDRAETSVSFGGESGDGGTE